MPTTRAQQALARFRAEEDAFRTVLDVLVQFRQNHLVVRVFGIYRARLRMLRLLAGGLLDEAEGPTAGEELNELNRKRSFTHRRDLTRNRDP